MTSSACWGRELSSTGSAWAIVLTHRRGCAVSVMKRDDNFDENSNAFVAELGRALRSVAVGQGLSHVSNENDILSSGSAEGGLLTLPSSGYAHEISAVPSAEGLWKCYKGCLSRVGLTDSVVSDVFVARGPVGSFTGLRIGAAFCSGLVVGRPRRLWGLVTRSVSEMKLWPGATPVCMENPQAGSEAWDRVGSDHGVNVLGIDLQLAWQDALSGKATPMGLGEVGYSAEPGPVRTLKAKLQKKKGAQ